MTPQTHPIKSMKANSLLRLVTLALTAVSFEASAQNMNLVIPPTGALPTGMTKTQFEGANIAPFGPTGQIQTNVRAISSRSTLNDYWVIQYAASQSGFGLTPVKADMYLGVGPYYEEEGLFMKDVSTNGSLKQGSTSLTWGRPSTLTFGAPVTARLETGNSVNVYMGPTAVDYVLVVKEVASGKVISQQPGSKSIWYFWPVLILRSGDYQFEIKSSDGSAIKTAIQFTHNNAAVTTTLTSGSTFSSSLAAKSFGYSKFKIRMTKGQKLKFTLTQSGTVAFRLISATGKLISADGSISSRSSLTLNAVTETSDYFLIFMKPWSTSGASMSVITNGIVQVLP